MRVSLILLGLILMVATTSVGANAASGKCTIIKIEGTTMEIICKKAPKGFREGTTIKIKTYKTPKVEGC